MAYDLLRNKTMRNGFVKRLCETALRNGFAKRLCETDFFLLKLKLA
jgi:hypothetical protein